MIFIAKNQSATRKFVPEFSRALTEGNMDKAVTLAEKHKASHVSRVLGGALGEVKPLIQDKATLTSADIKLGGAGGGARNAHHPGGVQAGHGRDGDGGRHGAVRRLLGTTMGIVTAFTGMAAAGASGGLAGISAGIAEALITTAFGLLVAIPAVWFYNYFTTKIENLTVEMTYSSKELIDYLIKQVGSDFGRSIFTKEFQAQKAVSGSWPRRRVVQPPAGPRSRRNRT